MTPQTHCSNSLSETQKFTESACTQAGFQQYTSQDITHALMKALSLAQTCWPLLFFE